MSFQAYLDTIKQKTGKTPDDFTELAAQKGLIGPTVKAGDVIAWLAADFGLGRGHAMAIYGILKDDGARRATSSEVKVDQLFSGGRAVWRPAFDNLLARLEAAQLAVTVAATDSYVSLLHGTKKFAIVKVTADRFDLGIKLKSALPTERFEAAGSWNTMVTHRVRIAKESELDDEVLEWLNRAYDAA